MVQVLQAKAIFDCSGDEESELTFLEGDILTDVRETSEDGWLHGRLERTGEEGLFPDNYVELIRVQAPVQPQLPPQLPSRTPAVSKAVDVAPAVEASMPQLPVRQNQASLVSGTRPVPPIDAPTNTPIRIGITTGANKVGLPGLGSRSMYGGTSSLDTHDSDAIRVVSGPPALPRRSNTVNEGGIPQEKATTPGTGLSARERMAALSMASQTARSPLSAAPRPALPPRNSTASSVDSGSSPVSTADRSPKHTYQVPDAAVPVPKLTTFSRPRSARTSKASSPVEQKMTNSAAFTPASRPIAAERQAMSTPPKLPSRNAGPGTPNATSNDSNGPVRFSPVVARTVPSDLPTLPVINRNSQPLPLPSRTALNPTAISSPGIARSAKIGNVRSTEASHLAQQDSATEHQNGPLGSAFGVKLSSIGPKPTTVAATPQEPNRANILSAPTSIAPKSTASGLTNNDFTPPPLPARSNTISTVSSAHITPAEALQKSPISKLRRETGQRPPFSPSIEASAQIQRDHEIARAAADQEQQKWNKAAVPHTESTVALLDALAWGNSDLKSQLQGIRGAAVPPARLTDATATEGVGIARGARRRYETLFRSVSKGEYIEGAKVHGIYVRSRLDSPTLAQIWDLVDVDNAGRLNKAQFCMGLYLIDERLGTGLIPLEVSDELWVSIMQ
ncbi:Increased rDNA silencing protein [Mortierella sp. GBA35]|nr:Increased rDNA silencing protein [Mortierella sp. GBA35]